MNFFKRAITSITRRLGKTIILLILVFILGNVISGAISIRQAVTNTEINLRKKIGAAATVEGDYEKIQSLPGFNSQDFDWSTIEFIKPEGIEKIGQLPYVKYYDYTTGTGLESSEFKEYVDPSSEIQEDGSILRPDGSISSNGYGGYTNFSFNGGQNPEPVAMKENKIKLAEGRLLTEEEIKNAAENKILVSRSFANNNGVSIGSIINFKMRILDYGEMRRTLSFEQPEPKKTLDFEFEIIGIFETIKEPRTNNQEAENNFYYMEESRENTIYASNAVVKNIDDIRTAEFEKVNTDPEFNFRGTGQEYQPLFVLNDPADLEAFREEASAMVPEYSKITDNGGDLDKVAGPMRNMSWIASIVLYVAIGATLLILSLLITLFLRDRKHEIGIYLSLGEKKKRVIMQIVTEVVLISFVAITLALFTGSLVAGIVSDKMLNNQMIADQENQNNNYIEYGRFSYIGYGGEVLKTEDLIESYKVSIGLTTILIFYLVGIGAVMVSTLIPIIYIVRLNPKKIMM